MTCQSGWLRMAAWGLWENEAQSIGDVYWSQVKNVVIEKHKGHTYLGHLE